MNSIPQHAAVNETVELCKKLGKNNWVKFLNGLLRSITRSLSEEYGSDPASNSIPLKEGEYLKFNSDFFSDPELEISKYFSEAFSFPGWLSKRWSEIYSVEDLLKMGHWFNTVHPVTLRVNLLKTTRDEYLNLLEENELESVKLEVPESIQIDFISFDSISAGIPGRKIHGAGSGRYESIPITQSISQKSSSGFMCCSRNQNRTPCRINE